MFIWVIPCALVTLATVVTKGQHDNWVKNLRRLHEAEKRNHGQRK